MTHNSATVIFNKHKIFKRTDNTYIMIKKNYLNAFDNFDKPNFSREYVETAKP
jgi:hypothetical protein